MRLPLGRTTTTCANAEPLIVGSQAGDLLPASGTIYFKTHLTAGRSYSLWDPPFQDASEGTTCVSLSLFSNTTCTTVATVSSITEREPLENISGADVDQISIKPTTSGTHVLAIANLTANTYNVAVTVVETSLFSPWWFVGGTNQAFVTFRNNMSSSTTVTLTLYGTNGSVCGTEDVGVNGNANTFRRINDYAACVTAGFGSAALTYFGPPGGISANVTVLNTDNGTSFDESFTARMVWSVLVR